MYKRAGFTIVELLVVVAILAALLTILFPAMRSVRQGAGVTACQANQSQIFFGIKMYAMSYKNYYPDPIPGRGTANWVHHGNSEANMLNGALGRFIDDAWVYHCPADGPKFRRGRKTLRSYSMPPGGRSTGGWNTQFNREYGMVKLDRTMIMLEEMDPRGANLGTWVTNKNRWVDWVAYFHIDGTNLLFADGHIDHYLFQDDESKKITWFFYNPRSKRDVNYIFSIMPWNVR